MENQFRTVTLFGKGRRYGAQLPGLDAPVWGDTPAELFTNLATAVQRMSPSATRETFEPLIETQTAHG